MTTYDKHRSVLTQGTKPTLWDDVRSWFGQNTWDTTLPDVGPQVQQGLLDLAKDMTPVQGPYRSAGRAGEEFDNAVSQAKSGDYPGALASGIWSGLEATDAVLPSIPLLGIAGEIATSPIDVARSIKNARKAEKPKKTQKAYKLFRTKKTHPDEIFPLFIGKDKPTKVGEWIDAENLPTKGFADRPGWHVGALPTAPHLMKKTGEMPPDRVWAEVEIPADKNWQSILEERGLKDLRDEVPEEGFYRFKRPTNQGGEWMIGGSMKVNRLLSNDEAMKLAKEGLNPGPLATAQDVIEARAKQMDLKPPDRIQPSGKNPLFELTPEAYERTSGLLEQKRLPGTPRVPPGEKFPLGERMKPIEDNMDEIAEVIANKSRPAMGTETQYFYNMGPVYEGLIKKGHKREEILDFLREFGEGYGATSPRTNTEFNMRNAMLLRSKEGRGKELSSIEGPGSGGISEKGYPMMDMHRNLYRDFVDQVDKMKNNPKPTHFKSGAQGNLLSVTADTHAIRGALVAMNDLNPGSLPKGWFKTKQAYDDYLENPTEWMSQSGNMGKINDGLQTKAKKGVKEQVEYGTMHDLYERVGEKLGVTPAEAQSLAWFSSGSNTNLASAPKSIPRLLDERIDVTAQALGLSKDEVLDLVVKNKLPLMGVGMAGLLSAPDQEQF